MSRSRSAPIGWDSGRLGHCFRMVVPTRDTGTHLRLHQRLTPLLKREDTEKNHEGYQSCEKILIKQRPIVKKFSCRVPLSTDEIQDITDRLYKYNPKFLPAESKRHLHQREKLTPPTQMMLNKPIYSTEEVRAIVSRLQKDNRNDDKSEDRSQKEFKVKERHSFYTAAEVHAIIDQVNNDPDDRLEQMKRVGSARPCSFRSRSNSLVRSVKSAGTQRSKEDIDVTTYRMTNPSESTSKRYGRKKTTELPSTKKVSGEQLEEIVKRLNKFNSRKWPPESKPEAKRKPDGNDSAHNDR